ncbi:MAG TPA: adenosylcobinamide amidohydrolase [Deltaproteobacteria bacterium]|nr:adenosylcobinamide amidohydrolase [Deltaproteobacteria bacterium]
MRKCFLFLIAIVSVPAMLLAAEIKLPENLHAQAVVKKGGRDGLWEKTLIVSFKERRRTLATFDGLLDAMAAVNHAAHPLLWGNSMGGHKKVAKPYTDQVYEMVAADLKLDKSDIAKMATAADMDNLAVVTLEQKPFTVTVLATAGAKTNALRAGVDMSSHVEGEEQHGTINIMVLTNARLTDGAMARAIVTVTEGKTAALQDLQVPSSYTKGAQATGTGTDSVIVVSGITGPKASYAGGHSLLGSLIGKATYQAVVEALGKQNGFKLPAKTK